MQTAKHPLVLAFIELHGFRHRHLIFNEAYTIPQRPRDLEGLQGHLVEISDRQQEILNAAAGEDRELNEDEQDEIDALIEEFTGAQADHERLTAIGSQSSWLNRSNRRTDPADPRAAAGDPDDPDDPDAGDPDDPDAGDPPDPSASQRGGNRRRQPRRRVPAQAHGSARERGREGWRNYGQFARAVINASRKENPIVHPLLIQNAPTTFGREGVGEDGGFAVPPTFRETIEQKVFGEDTLLARTMLLESTTNTWNGPKDETTPWQTTGGIQAAWEGEADQLTQSKPKLGTNSLRLNKLTALVGVTEEMLEDSAQIESYLNRKAPEKIDFKVQNAIVDGTGAGQPHGILRAPGLITVAKEAGQTADTIVYGNVSKMWNRVWAPWRANAVWLANQDIEPQLDLLEFPGDSSPVYVPPGGLLSQSPFGTLKGRPIIFTQASKTLGDAGDLMLVDLAQYLAIRKVGGLRAQMSIHLWFDFDVTAFRFIIRLAGQPWWESVIQPLNGSNTYSYAATVAERA